MPGSELLGHWPVRMITCQIARLVPSLFQPDRTLSQLLQCWVSLLPLFTGNQPSLFAGVITLQVWISQISPSTSHFSRSTNILAIWNSFLCPFHQPFPCWVCWCFRTSHVCPFAFDWFSLFSDPSFAHRGSGCLLPWWSTTLRSMSWASSAADNRAYDENIWKKCCLRLVRHSHLPIFLK